MKKNYLILVIIYLIFSYTHAKTQFIEGHQYIRLQKSVQNAPELLEFFSFYCSHCYQFEQILHIICNNQDIFPIKTHITKYHIAFLGDLGKQLTHAWAVATALNIENIISPLLFKAIQKQQSIHTIEDIRNIFIQSGIDEKEYDSAWNSILVQSLITNQEKAAIDFHINGIPSIFIKGIYMIKHDKLDISSINIYTQQFYELLNLLLTTN